MEQHERANVLLNGTKVAGDNNAETERRKAALYVATQASDPVERLELLRMLGLADPGFEWVGQQNRRKVPR